MQQELNKKPENIKIKKDWNDLKILWAAETLTEYLRLSKKKRSADRSSNEWLMPWKVNQLIDWCTVDKMHEMCLKY